MDIEINDLAVRYRGLNAGFKKRLVFRSGIDAGFFAEFKYMVNAVIYCLQNELQFCLYSRGANYGAGGWSEYFEPFCPEVDDAFNDHWNVHSLPPLAELRRRNPAKSGAALLAWELKTAIRGRAYGLVSLTRCGRYALSTYNVPNDVPARCRIPALGLDCTYGEAFQAVASMLWRPNARLRDEERRLMRDIALPARYAGTQIRGGDKVTEVSLLPPEVFVEALRKATPLKDVLLLTDDYALLERVRRDYPEYTWHSLCTPQERGYVNAAFALTDPATKHSRMVRLIAQVDALLRSEAFVGSTTVGPSLFVLQMKYPDGTPVDCRTEDIPDIARLAIRERGDMAERFLRSRHGTGDNA